MQDEVILLNYMYNIESAAICSKIYSPYERPRIIQLSPVPLHSSKPVDDYSISPAFSGRRAITERANLVDHDSGDGWRYADETDEHRSAPQRCQRMIDRRTNWMIDGFSSSSAARTTAFLISSRN